MEEFVVIHDPEGGYFPGRSTFSRGEIVRALAKQGPGCPAFRGVVFLVNGQVWKFGDGPIPGRKKSRERRKDG